MKRLSAPHGAGVPAAQRLRGLLLLAALVHLTATPLLSADSGRFFRIVGPAAISVTGISSDGYVTWTNAVTNVTCSVQTALRLVGLSDWVDYVQVPVSNHVITHRLFDPNPPPGMVLIPAGSFTMGNCMGTNDGYDYELPLHTVYVSACYMDKCEVTKALWDEVKEWNGGNGYSYDYPGSGKATNHPVHAILWYDAVKWCNARSEEEGRVPVYYTDAELTQVYKAGGEPGLPYVKWDANGYRLPTEAEWEKGARGGVVGHRFPWSDVDTISHSQANYDASSYVHYSYDLSYPAGCHPEFNDSVKPYTSPVGYFAPNGYGLYDMAGNIWEYCWDWLELYSEASQIDPRGPTSGSYRMVRGGDCLHVAATCRAAARFWVRPDYAYYGFGFRCVRGL
jgi:formylglycine-generating enzyme required for sulfatase activity